MKICLVVWLLTTIFFAAACDSVRRKQEFKQRNEQWKGQNVYNYRYTVKKLRVGEDNGKAVLMEVRNGRSISMVCQECELAAPDAFRRLDTMEKVFEIVSAGVVETSHHKEVRYDQNYGFPVYWKGEMRTPSGTNIWENEISNFEVIK